MAPYFYNTQILDDEAFSTYPSTNKFIDKNKIWLERRLYSLKVTKNMRIKWPSIINVIYNMVNVHVYVYLKDMYFIKGVTKMMNKVSINI